MKIWIDVLTPKEVKFFQPMVKKLSKKHVVLCTSRNYKEVTALAKINNFKITVIGCHGGSTKEGKLDAAIDRMKLLAIKIKKFSPNLLISFCSPDASRVAFGLGIKHIAFSDMPYAEKQMKLTIPFSDKLLTPNMYTKKSFTKYGIQPRNVIQYNAIDAAFIKKHKTTKTDFAIDKSKKVILIRMPEDQASYMPNTSYMHIIKAIVKKFESENVIVLARYKEQITALPKILGNKVRIIDMRYDGKALLEKCDVFVGSGGTMTTEASLMGIPCVSMNLFHNAILDFLVQKKLLKIVSTPSKMISTIQQFMLVSRSQYKKRAKTIVSNMEDPYDVLLKTMQM
ncbi:MAG: hypothetical protein K8823_1342 [Cenarchaeum symbiont of Oopsacas minuta]|nr:hypothetical protein [Cenarchaeum symbiont of Oopsacas minuta]